MTIARTAGRKLIGVTRMNEYKTTIRGLIPGDKVMLRLPDVKGLTDAERENRRIIEATVVAIYPHCIHFKTEFGYSVSPAIMVAQEMVSGVEYHGRCPGNERVIGRRAGGKTRKGWKVYE